MDKILREVKKDHGNKAFPFWSLAIGDIFCYNIESIERKTLSNFKIKLSEKTYSYVNNKELKHTIQDCNDIIYRK